MKKETNRKRISQKVVACIIARTNSTRLPQKVLLDVNGKKLIEYIINKLKRSTLIDQIYICTSTDPNDDILSVVAQENNVFCYQGSKFSILERLNAVCEKEKADHVVRITGDNIFCDETYIDIMVENHINNNSEFTRTEYLPLGVTAEIISHKALKKSLKFVPESFSEYLTLYLFDPDNFKCQIIIPEKSHRQPFWSLTVDTKDDYNKVLTIIKNTSGILNYSQILSICKKNNIENLETNSFSSIKFPASITMTYQAFRKEMELRIKKSSIVYLKDNEYNDYIP